jgi:undecaprenyl-diphosphatase
MAWALIIGGIVMWIVDAIYSKKFRVDHMEQMSLGQAIWIGACQVLSAVFPGTSRSMSTIAAGQLAGMSRESALEFSFFLSMPTMAAATLYDLLKFLRHGGVGAMNHHEWIILMIGFVVSFFVAWGVVAWFMHWVRRHGFVPFAVYRILAGIVVLVWLSRLV